MGRSRETQQRKVRNSLRIGEPGGKNKCNKEGIRKREFYWAHKGYQGQMAQMNKKRQKFLKQITNENFSSVSVE